MILKPDHPNLRLFDQLFAIDVRSLAILRMGLALVILYDLSVNRFPYLAAFYSDTGFLSRELSQQLLGDGYWSLYWRGGSVSSMQVFLSVNLVAAISLLVGYQTRIATVLCLILIWSLQVINPLVLNGGDILLRMLLFWSVFLPLGAVWSVDERFSKYERPSRYYETSIASAAMMLQIAMMYFFSGLAKCNSYWVSGEAVEYALHLEMYTKPLGGWLSGLPWLLTLITWVVLVVEIIGPPLMFSPISTRFLRGLLMGFFWLMHIGIWLTMSVGLFSLIAMLSWVIFLPPQSWHFLVGKRQDYDEIYPSEYPVWKTIGSLVCGAALVLVMAQHLLNLAGRDSELRRVVNQAASSTMCIQQFKLWGIPPDKSPSFGYPATLENGDQVNLFFRHREPPQRVYDQMPSHHWRRIHSELLEGRDPKSETYSQVRQQFLQWLVRRWNVSQVERADVETARIICFEKPILPEGGYGPVEESVLCEYGNLP